MTIFRPIHNLLILPFVATYFFGAAAISKIGGSVDAFQQQEINLLVYKKQTSGGDKTYYHYAIVKDSAQQKASAGFAGGLTLTASASKIQGESLVIRLGANQTIGKVFATAIFMDLTYEALGKPVPASEASRASEFAAYTNAVNKALDGQPQTIKYKNYLMNINISKTKDSDLLLAITPTAH